MDFLRENVDLETTKRIEIDFYSKKLDLLSHLEMMVGNAIKIVKS